MLRAPSAKSRAKCGRSIGACLRPLCTLARVVRARASPVQPRAHPSRPVLLSGKKAAGKRAGRRGALSQSITNAYGGACTACGVERTCAACLQTAGCERCTLLVACCGSCRNVHSRAHRAAGLCSSRGAAVAGRSTLPCGVAPSPVDSLDLPRARAGLNCLSCNAPWHAGCRPTRAVWGAQRPAAPRSLPVP